MATIASYGHLQEGVSRFRKTGLVLFGNVKFAFKELSRSANEARLSQYVQFLGPVDEASFRGRHEHVLPIDPIPPDKTYLLGYLVERELQKRLEQNPDNTETRTVTGTHSSVHSVWWSHGWHGSRSVGIASAAETERLHSARMLRLNTTTRPPAPVRLRWLARLPWPLAPVLKRRPFLSQPAHTHDFVTWALMWGPHANTLVGKVLVLPSPRLPPRGRSDAAHLLDRRGHSRGGGQAETTDGSVRVHPAHRHRRVRGRGGARRRRGHVARRLAGSVDLRLLLQLRQRSAALLVAVHQGVPGAHAGKPPGAHRGHGRSAGRQRHDPL